MKIILGSQSKNRKKILEEMGINFEIMSPNIDEKAIRLENPKELVLALARAKAEALKSRINEPALLITSDQVIVCQGQIREKPENEKEAREFLKSYSIFPAETVTSVLVTNLATGEQIEAVDVVKIYLKPFSDGEINEIIKEGRTFELAGGFTVDGEIWERHIDKIEGTIDSVMGLPKDITQKLIDEVK